MPKLGGGGGGGEGGGIIIVREDGDKRLCERIRAVSENSVPSKFELKQCLELNDDKEGKESNGKNQSKNVNNIKKLNKKSSNNFSIVKIQIENCCSDYNNRKILNKDKVNDKEDSKRNYYEREKDIDISSRGYGFKNCPNKQSNAVIFKDKDKRGKKYLDKMLTSSTSSSTSTSTSLSQKLKPSCSPFKKLSKSSLTIEPDKITVNLSKYSPCASRLAASSKIISSKNSPTSPESPLRSVIGVDSKRELKFSSNRLSSSSSLSVGGFSNRRENDCSSRFEKSTIQASLSLNIKQFQQQQHQQQQQEEEKKTSSNVSCYPTTRSKSVGDSCVTSPMSEGTTTSFSPTGTEILSLEDVGFSNIVNDNINFNCLPPSPPPPPPPPPPLPLPLPLERELSKNLKKSLVFNKDLNRGNGLLSSKQQQKQQQKNNISSKKTRKTTLETKC